MDWIWWVWYGFDMRYGMVHGWEMMNFGYELGMWFKWKGWLLKWHGISMRGNSIFMVWEEWVGMDSTRDMNEDWL